MQATGGGQQLLNLWRVDRPAEAAGFARHSQLDNRKLLWHGTNIAVMAAIIKAGLRIMPNAGGRLGRGLYLASEHSKSAGYVRCGYKDRHRIGVSLHAACTCLQLFRSAWMRFAIHQDILMALQAALML